MNETHSLVIVSVLAQLVEDGHVDTDRCGHILLAVVAVAGASPRSIRSADIALELLQINPIAHRAWRTPSVANTRKSTTRRHRQQSNRHTHNVS